MLSIAVVLLMSVASSMAGHRYEAFSDLASFADAQAKCASHGGELAVPENAEHASEITSALTAVDSSINWAATEFSDYKFYWLNIEEDEDNEPLTELAYSNYHSTQPNRANEECVAAATGRWNGEWSDRPCDAVLPFVCQYEHNDLDCWKNKRGSKLTKLEGNYDVLDKHNYKKRADAVIKCQVAAQEGGYDFAAVGNGGQCFAGHGDDYMTFGQYPSRKCPANGKGRYGVVHVYQFIEAPEPETITTTEPAPTTTPEPTHVCGSGACKDRSEYCSSDSCKALRAKSDFCSNDRQCLSKDCTWLFKCK